MMNVQTSFLLSGIFLSVLCPITLLANAFLLLAIYKDPLKTFHGPTACFLVALSIADLTSGLVPQPMVSTCYFLWYRDHPKQIHCPKIMEIAGKVNAILTNLSFFIVLAFSLVQYIVVAHPLRSKELVTTCKTRALLVIISLYAILFEMTKYMGLPQDVLEKIDLHLHSTFSLLLTIIIYMLLQKAFRRQMVQASATLTTGTELTEVRVEPQEGKSESSSQNEKQQRQRLEVKRQFVRLNLVVIVVLLVCSQPSAILWYLDLYSGARIKNSHMLFQIRVIAENTLYLKFLLDPFVFAWRIPEYREALRRALC